MAALRERKSQIDAAQDKLGVSGVIKGDKESIVGKQLSDHITKKVVVLVLAMIFSSPIFTVTNYV